MPPQHARVIASFAKFLHGEFQCLESFVDAESALVEVEQRIIVGRPTPPLVFIF
jgi:hypothetical protein